MKPLILHVLYRFDTGGLENGVVNLINRLDDYRHVVVAVDTCAEGFCQRVQRADTEFIALQKPPGQTARVMPKFVRELKRLQPAVVHTRNLAALELQAPAWWVGGAARVHGEHGRDSDDLHGLSKRHQWMRRIYRPFVQRYVALSGELEQYLVQRVGVPPARIRRICNGVDMTRFQAPEGRQAIEGSPFNDPSLFVVGAVGRMQTVKGQTFLVRAFIQAVSEQPALRQTLRLMLVGDGPLRAECQLLLDQAGLAELAWLTGERRDVPQLMQGMDAFALPSLAEGISNTILEAMASGLPVVATDVGGNSELVDRGVTGELVASGESAALAAVLRAWSSHPARAKELGRAGRVRALERFSLDGMVRAYDTVYREAMAAAAGR